MSKIIMSIGIPGSGKSFFMRQLAIEKSFKYICTDDIREELHGDASNQSRGKEVWNIAKERALTALNIGETVVFDATFADVDYRQSFLSFLKENNIKEIEGIYFNVDLELAKERNRNRDRKVPESVLETMYKSLSDFPPSLQEGFSSLTLFSEYK